MDKSVLHKLRGRCISCENWTGNREKAVSDYVSNPFSMDLERGWPEDGGCKVDYEFLDTVIRGDATADITFNANFGCIYWHPHQPPESE